MIGPETSAGGQDWSSIAGNVLCDSCYVMFAQNGSMSRPRPVEATGACGGRCSYLGCDTKLDEGFQVFAIPEGLKAGGRDWSFYAGSTLCSVCFRRFRETGSLDKSACDKRGQHKCDGPGCPKPFDSQRFRYIKDGTVAGGQDWSSLTGMTLCHGCYTKFIRTGKLEKERYGRNDKRRGVRRCSYELCDRPDESFQFLEIKEGKTTGGQDWSSLVGKILCNTCYCRFKNKGTLKRDAPLSRPWHDDGKCSNEASRGQIRQKRKKWSEGKASASSSRLDCLGQAGEQAMHQTAGQQESRGTQGNVQEQGMHQTAHQQESAPLSISTNLQRCSYAKCTEPEASVCFHHIRVGATAGGRDWSTLAGSMLCNPCYVRFMTSGVLGKVVEETACNDGSKAASHTSLVQGKESHHISPAGDALLNADQASGPRPTGRKKQKAKWCLRDIDDDRQ